MSNALRVVDRDVCLAPVLQQHTEQDNGAVPFKKVDKGDLNMFAHRSAFA